MSLLIKIHEAIVKRRAAYSEGADPELIRQMHEDEKSLWREWDTSCGRFPSDYDFTPHTRRSMKEIDLERQQKDHTSQNQ